MTGVVIDTNVVISSFLNEEGSEAAVVDLVLARELQLFASEAIFAEYERTLSRPKFSLHPEQIKGLLGSLRAIACLLHPTESLSVSPDESDNRFLECANTAEASFLVTGNKRHFPQAWKTTRIVNARELLSLIDSP